MKVESCINLEVFLVGGFCSNVRFSRFYWRFIPVSGRGHMSEIDLTCHVGNSENIWKILTSTVVDLVQDPQKSGSFQRTWIHVRDGNFFSLKYHKDVSGWGYYISLKLRWTISIIEISVTYTYYMMYVHSSFHDYNWNIILTLIAVIINTFQWQY